MDTFIVLGLPPKTLICGREAKPPTKSKSALGKPASRRVVWDILFVLVYKGCWCILFRTTVILFVSNKRRVDDVAGQGREGEDAANQEAWLFGDET